MRKTGMISVIIPVYNTEKYVGQCIDSVLASTYLNYEILVIDDGSTDHSLEICRCYSRKERRIKLFTQKHEGVSAARNRGIAESSGEWILFVDSDDSISEKFLEHVAEKKYQKMELLFFDHAWIGKRNRQRVQNSEPDIHYYHTEDMPAIIGKMLYADKLTEGGNSNLLSPCGKAFKKSVIEEYAVRFPTDLVIGEDKIFNLQYYLRMDRCAYISETVYFVRWRADSSTHCFQQELIKNHCILQKRLRELLKQSGLWNVLERAYYENVFSAMTEVLVYGIFHPCSTKPYREKCKLCNRLYKDKRYRKALEANGVTGGLPRRVLLFFFNRGYYAIVALICKLSYYVLQILKK